MTTSRVADILRKAIKVSAKLMEITIKASDSTLRMSFIGFSFSNASSQSVGSLYINIFYVAGHKNNSRVETHLC